MFQRLLWNVAGAELDILNKCRTDHKKFSAIGATILMTSFIAFLAGTAAAWFFTQSGDSKSGNIWWALLFGVVWSLLIFSIDRSLVITLKKDPTLPKQKFWVPLLSRAALAIIIAFMVSIPLELVIFEDFIAGQKYFFNEATANELSESTHAHAEEISIDKEIDYSTQFMSRLDSVNGQLQNDATSLESQIAELKKKIDNPTSKAYLDAKNQYDTCTKKILAEESKLKEASNYQDSLLCLNEIAKQKNERRPHNKKMGEEKQKWNKEIKEEIGDKEEQLKGIRSQIQQNAVDYGKESERLSQNRDSRDSLVKVKTKIVDDFNKTTKKGNHFIQDFRVLEYAVHKRDANGNRPKELLFLWMIRVLFFIIEILPTVVKIVTPIGSYDRMVYAEEEGLKNYLDSDEYSDRIKNLHDAELEAKEEQLRQQHETELELKKDILEKIKVAQTEVADAIIAQWKNEELAKITNHEETSIT